MVVTWDKKSSANPFKGFLAPKFPDFEEFFYFLFFVF
jgi:hypothetical protein